MQELLYLNLTNRSNRIPIMPSTPYTDREQTPAQRQQLIEQARAWVVAQGATPGPAAEAVYARYVAGELSLQDVTDELVQHYAQQPAALVAARRSQAMQPEQLELT